MTSKHPHALALAQLAAGELASPVKAEVEKHLAACSSCSSAFAAQARNAAEYSLNDEARLHALRARIAATSVRPSVFRRWAMPVFALTCVAMLLVVVTRESAPPGPSYKGAASVSAIIQHGSAQRALGDHEIVAPGDAVRLIVTLDRPLYFAAAWVDVSGVPTLVYPHEVNSQPLLVAGPGPVALEGSLVLDESVGDERLVWRLSSEPFSVSAFLGESTALQPGASIGVIHVRKAR